MDGHDLGHVTIHKHICLSEQMIIAGVIRLADRSGAVYLTAQLLFEMTCKKGMKMSVSKRQTEEECVRTQNAC